MHTLTRHEAALFFAISGFLITSLLLRDRDEHDLCGMKGPGGINLKDFYLRRALRISPLYFATFAICLVLVPLFHQDAQVMSEFWGNLISFAT